MAVFGIGHGILTITFDYAANMFFRAEVYVRVQRLIVLHRGIGGAVGPSMGSILIPTGARMVFWGDDGLVNRVVVEFSCVIVIESSRVRQTMGFLEKFTAVRPVLITS